MSKIFLGWDKAQAEARVVAYKSWLVTGDPTYKNLVESGTKVHVWVGHRFVDEGVFDCPKECIKGGLSPGDQGYIEYYISKQSVHATSYGEGAPAFAKHMAKNTDGMIILPIQKAKKIQDIILDAIPAIAKWQRAIQIFLEDNKVMRTAFGRVGIFWERWGHELFKKYYAFEPQSTVGDDVAKSIQRVHAEFPEYQCLQQNYDSLLGQCDEAIWKDVMTRMRPVAEQVIPLTNFENTKRYDLVVPVVFKVGKNWKEMEELK